jgi:hypothetical protein
MIEVRDRYNADILVPMPDVHGAPNLPPLMPQLIHDGIEGLALRAAGQLPALAVPPKDPYSEESRKRADVARRALSGRWSKNRMNLLLRRGYRQLCGYGTQAMVVLPDGKGDGATIESRDPLTAYPESRSSDTMDDPLNCGFIFGRSQDWIIANYPEARSIINDNRQFEGMWDMVEWVDEDDVVVGLLGPRELFYERAQIENLTGLELRRWKNRAGRCTAIVPRRVTLDRIIGQLHQIIPIVDWMSRIMALDLIATEKAIFPDIVALGENGQSPMLAGNDWKDGRTGEINLLTGAKGVQPFNPPPGGMTGQMLDRLERAGRLSGGVSAQFGGEMTGAIRSGRTVEAMGSFSIDPQVTELQDIMSYALESVNSSIIAVEKGYFGSKTFSMYSGWPGDGGLVEYKPSRDFESEHTAVTYNFPGTDISQITVGVAQMTGADLMSKHTARRVHPFVQDAAFEEERINKERVEDAIIAAFQQQANSGAVPLIDAVAVAKEIAKGKNALDAIVSAHEAAQARQAAPAAEVPGPEGAPIAPGAQPGLSLPGMGAEQLPVPPQQSPDQGLQNVQQLFDALRQPTAPRAAAAQ